jgi:hypothetical protein
MYLPNDIFLPLVLDELRQHPGKTATINLRGRSMRPFLEDGRDKAILQLVTGDDWRKGDAVLAEIQPGHYVLHRIDAISSDGKVTLMGDGNLGYEHCHKEDLRAKAVGFYRKGRQKADLTTELKWRAYSWLWTRLKPLRRYLLFACHPHIPQSIKRNKKNES